MKSKKRKNGKSRQKVDFFVIEQDLSYVQPVDGVATSVIECLEDKVSPELFDLLKEVLLGFSDDMQLEIADDLLDFVCRHVIHTTGCVSADAVLAWCYQCIAEEKRFSIIIKK